jgi:hypothetical protein
MAFGETYHSCTLCNTFVSFFFFFFVFFFPRSSCSCSSSSSSSSCSASSLFCSSSLLIPSFLLDSFVIPHKGIKYLSIKLFDSQEENISSHFDTALNFIEEGLRDKDGDEDGDEDEEREVGEGRVLVHCDAGVSRSATIVIAYLIRHLRMNLTTAHNLVKERRPYIAPNLGNLRLPLLSFLLVLLVLVLLVLLSSSFLLIFQFLISSSRFPSPTSSLLKTRRNPRCRRRHKCHSSRDLLTRFLSISGCFTSPKTRLPTPTNP